MELGPFFRPVLELGCGRPHIGTMQLRVALRFRVRFAVPERGAQFQHWAPHDGTVPVWGRPRPSFSTGRKIGPSSSTGPVPIWGPTYIMSTCTTKFQKTHIGHTVSLHRMSVNFHSRTLIRGPITT